MQPAAERLANALEPLASGLILVVTGAGISSASGIPTFRGPEPEAVWKQHDLEKATLRYFLEDPVGQWQWYLDRFATLEGARPNPAHRALADLERWQIGRGGRFLLVTQNIDTLHEQAGSRELIKVHGTSDRLRCTAEQCDLGSPAGSLPREEVDLEPFRRAPALDSLPRCPRCGSLLRAHVLFFDEYYQEHDDYRFAEVVAAAEEAGVVVFAGTSFSVGITDLALQGAALRAVTCFSIDPNASSAPPAPLLAHLEEAAETLLPELVRRLVG